MLAVFYLDVTNYQDILTSQGENQANAYLLAITNCIKKTLRAEDTIARVKDDAFVMLLEDITNEHYAIKTIQRVLSALAEPLSVNQHTLQATVSIGVSIFPDKAADPNKMEMLDVFAEVNQMLYKITSSSGTDDATILTVSKPLQKKLSRYIHISQRLKEAISKGEFELYYQPQIDPHTCKLNAMEALIRWNNAFLHNPSPEEFIPIAEEIGMITEIGEWVVKTALEQYKKWNLVPSTMGVLRMSINISPTQILDDNLVSMIDDILKDGTINTSNILFEITETAFLINPHFEKSKLIQYFKKMGVGLSIDDFGTGHASLTYLKKLPIKELKIDLSFVKDIGKDKNNETIIKAIIALARTLGIQVVAEGVETKAQFDFLAKHECDKIQGYYFSKPLSVSDMSSYIKAHIESFCHLEEYKFNLHYPESKMLTDLKIPHWGHSKHH